MDPASGQLVTYAVAGVALVIVLAFRLRRMRKGKPLKLGRLWIVPTLYAAFAAVLIYYLPPRGWQWLWVIAALIAGGGVGWLWGRTMRIAVDPVTHALNHRQSPAALIVLAALVCGRFAAREQFGANLAQAGAGVIDAFVAFAVGLLALQRVEMFLRARRMLRSAQASSRSA